MTSTNESRLVDAHRLLAAGHAAQAVELSTAILHDHPGSVPAWAILARAQLLLRHA
jgi:hypothetical protein